MIDLLATQRHYEEHLRPVWDALPEDARGTIGAKSSDAVVVAAQQDIVEAQRLGYRRIALLEHGIGQSYANQHPAYPGGRRRDAVGLFLSPNETAAGMDRRAYPKARVEIVGCPKLDTLPRQVGSAPVACISFHWHSELAPETRATMPYYRPVLRELSRSFELIGHAHPRMAGMMRREYGKLGIEWVADFREVCERAAVYACDNSSTIFEFASTDRPVVVLNAPWYRRGTELGLRFWRAASVGVNVDRTNELAEAIALALTDPPEVRGQREAALDVVYGYRHGAARRAAHVLIDWSREMAVRRSAPVSAPVTAPRSTKAPRVAICVPFRPDGGRRSELWAYVERHWRKLLPGVPIVTGAPEGTWNTSAARNIAAAGDWDVAVFVDADTVMRRVEPLREAIEIAHRTGQLVLPHESYFALSKAGTDAVLAGDKKGWLHLARTVHKTPLGVAVVPRTAWRLLGGFDERFEGWGGEDAAFVEAATTLVGLQRLPGEIWHLEHPVDPTQPAYRRTKGGAVRAAYREAFGDVGAMGQLLAARQPLRIVIAASRTNDARWGGYLGLAKQLVPVGHETLLARTVRLLRPHGEVVVVHGDDGPFPIDVEQAPARNDPQLGDINAVVNARHLWSKAARTLLVLGDVYLTEAAIATLVAPRDEWTLYGRRDKNPLTGKPWDEQYALSFSPDEQPAIVAAAERAAALVRAGKARWARFPQWYRAMHGVADEKVDLRRLPQPDLGHFAPIEDETDDIDKPEDYDRLAMRLGLLTAARQVA